MQLARPKKYENPNERHKAYYGRKKAAKTAAEEVVAKTQEAVKAAEVRGFIAMGEAPLLKKLDALIEVLKSAEELQLRINGELR